MLKAHNVNGMWVLATNALRGVCYYCPVCHEPLAVVKDSKHKIDHFRHHPDSTCSYGANETIEHAEKKIGIYQSLQSELGENNVSMEHTLPDGQRPDIYFQATNGQGVALEIQHSRISDAELIDRTASYADKGVASLWMPDQIKHFLNTVEVSDLTGLANIPLWMRRIAGLTDDVAFDQFSDVSKRGSEVVSIKLAIQTRKVKNANGVWVMEQYWPTRRCALHRGAVRTDRNDSGHKLMLWLPSPLGGDSLVSTKPKRQQIRREVIESTGAPVDCPRPLIQDTGAIRVDEKAPSHETTTESTGTYARPSYFDKRMAEFERFERLADEIAVPSNQVSFDDMLKEFWSNHDSFSFADRLKMWGFK